MLTINNLRYYLALFCAKNTCNSFLRKLKSKKALFLTVISTYGLKQNKYAGLVQNDLDMKVLFED